ncbi:MAG: hypothetical protein ACSLFP_09150 [Acidimicrobiales bacterium]
MMAWSRPVLGRVVRRSLGGRRIDPNDPGRGRFGRHDINRLVDGTFDEVERLWPVARLERLPTSGSRLNVALAVLTVALYRALVRVGVPSGHALDLVSDTGWRLYRLGARPIVLAARLRHRDPHRRMVTALQLFLRFPFSAPGRPGYEVEAHDGTDGYLTTWTWCPPLAFVQDLIKEQGDQGELEAFRRSWCSYDWALNDVLTAGRGAYRRPHTLSAGDDRCDMTWAVSDHGPDGTLVHLRPQTGTRTVDRPDGPTPEAEVTR